jgi:two-component system, oxyanion-binding sensor
MSSSSSSFPAIRIGFSPLLDCAILAVAHEMGFAAAEGITLDLVREISWANIRDKLALGYFDAAHCLAPMAISTSLGATGRGLGQLRTALTVPFALGLNGNSIAVSGTLFDEMSAVAKGKVIFRQPMHAGAALHAIARMRQAENRRPIIFGTVFPASCHTYQLRHWLKLNAMDPDQDVELQVLPPSMMADALAGGYIDGFCAGEPWGSVAVHRGVGRKLLYGRDLWSRGPEKILAVRQAWSDAHPVLQSKLLRALHAAALWCDTPENRIVLAALLARPAYLDLPAEILESILCAAGDLPGDPPGDAIIYQRDFANFPWPSQCAWLAAHMMAAGHLRPGYSAEALASLFRPDVLRDALRGIAALPAADTKTEASIADLPVPMTDRTMATLPAAPAFDGEAFDAAMPDLYLAHLTRSRRRTP